MTDLTNVSGIGPATAKLLSAHGIATAEDLARAPLDKLVSVPGFGESRAAAIRESANAFLESMATTGNPGTGQAPTKVKVPKGKEKAKSKKQKTGKKKSAKSKKPDGKDKKKARKDKKKEKKKPTKQQDCRQSNTHHVGSLIK